MAHALIGLGTALILDSGFCVLAGVCTLSSRAVYAAAQIKKRRYWPKNIPGDYLLHEFEDYHVGDMNDLAGTLNNVQFHVYGMKEPE